MKNIYVPSRGPNDWRALLADPEKHWRDRYSAKTLAERWETSKGIPSEVEGPLREVFPDIRVLLAFPEFKVALPGGSHASQNDVWVIARSGESLISIAVEGKVEEPFDRPVSEWLTREGAEDGERTGKIERWTYLKAILGLESEPDGKLMYQLFHRTASALILAKEFRADHAVLVVHSFSAKSSWFSDYSQFLQLFGIVAVRGKLQPAVRMTPIALHFLWASGELKG